MRETNLNKSINRTDVKVGDKIRISREVVVTGLREDSLYVGGVKDRKPVTIVNTATDTMALTEKEAVTLLERDKESEIKIPASATHVFWQDMDDYDYYARRNEVSEEWITSEGPDDTYTTQALIEAIEEGVDFDEYQTGTFQVLKHKYATGGLVGGMSRESTEALRSQLGANILPRNLFITSRMGAV